MNQTEGGERATRKQDRMKSAGDRALLQAAELNDAANLVASNRLMLGAHHLVLTVFSDRRDAIPDIVNAAWTDLAKGGAVVIREGKAIEAAWGSTIPGNLHLAPRPGVVSSRNFAAMAPLYNFPAGPAKGPWGEPIAMVRTTGGTPRRVHLHTDGVANWLVTGETGSGKTVWLSWVITQANRLGASVVLWDKDRGLEPCARALGGTYLRLGVPTGLAPLKALTDSDEDITFLAGLTRAMVSSGGPYEWTPEEDRRLHLGLKAIMSFPPEDRWFGELRACLGASRSGAGARLERWCWGKELGGIVDCPEDTVRFDADVIGFDQTDILDNADARGPVMAVLFYRTRRRVDGRRFIFVVDEFWRALAERNFAFLAADSVRTWRKKGAAVVLATQSVRDGLNSPIAHTLREQIPNLATFTNPRSSKADYLEIGHTEAEYEVIRDLPKGRGWFLLKQGTVSAKVQLPLSDMQDDLAVMSGKDENLPALEAACARVGTDDPVRLVAEFHKLRKESVTA